METESPDKLYTVIHFESADIGSNTQDSKKVNRFNPVDQTSA